MSADFSTEDLFDAIDRSASELLDHHRIDEPPVDAITLAQEAFNLVVRFAEDADDEPAAGRFGPRPRRRNPREVVLRMDQSDEGRNAVCARACGKELLPAILTRLGVAPGTENRSAQNQLLGLIAPRILLPTKWFARDARKAGFDLWAIKDRYPTAAYEMIAWRILDVADDPVVVSIIDDGVVAARRGNMAAPGKVLTAAEQECLDRLADEGEPLTVRREDWTARGWPIPTGPFNRIILRAVPDEI